MWACRADRPPAPGTGRSVTSHAATARAGGPIPSTATDVPPQSISPTRTQCSGVNSSTSSRPLGTPRTAYTRPEDSKTRDVRRLNGGSAPSDASRVSFHTNSGGPGAAFRGSVREQDSAGGLRAQTISPNGPRRP